MGAERIVSEMAVTWEMLPQLALRFCLSIPRITTVLIGARTEDELEQALLAEASGSLSVAELESVKGLAMHDAGLLNPAKWPLN
jgi:aryl-alcohol dehydrogenase-like predicted oxidoreductase